MPEAGKSAEASEEEVFSDCRLSIVVGGPGLHGEEDDDEVP